MTTPNDGGPAFPFKCQGPTTAPEPYYGMSLRDYFAASALTGLLANAASQNHEGYINGKNRLVQQAFAIADIALIQRKVQP